MKLVNRLTILLIAAALVLFMIWKFIGNFKNPFAIKSIETTHNIILQQTKTLGKLELSTYLFKDIVEQKLVIDYFPDPKALLIVYGEAIGCIDLTKISDGDINVMADSVHINLPAPELCSYKIDHSKSTIYDASYAFMNEALLFEEAYKAAEIKLKESAINAGILEKTKENASLILTPMFEKVSGKKIGFSFK